MNRAERVMGWLGSLRREYEEPLRGTALVQARLRWEDWNSLREEAVAFAKEEIRRRKWRGMHGGMLPDGYDAEDAADQAIREMLGGHCRLVFGFTRPKIVAELKRLVGQRVRALHGLREAGAVRSEWDALSRKEGDAPVSVLVGMADKVSSEAAEREEANGELKQEILDYLKGEPELGGVFECLWAGVTRPAEMAKRLGMGEQEVKRARKRLERRMAEFAKTRGRKTRLGG